MRYLLALVCPPLALLACGKVYQAMFNAALAGLWVAYKLAPDDFGSAFRGLSPFALGALLLVFNGYFGPLITVLHAVVVVASENRERRHKEQIAAMDLQAKMQRGILRQVAQAVARPVIVIQQPQAVPRVVSVPKVIEEKRAP